MESSEHDRRKGMHVRALMAQTGEGFIVLGADGHIRIFNETAERFFGVERASARDNDLSVLGIDSIAAAASAVLEGGSAEPLVVETREYILSCKFVPFEDASGRGVAVVIRDDTELMAQQEKGLAILKGASDGLVVFAPDSRVTYMNPAACEMLGMGEGEAVGRRMPLHELLGMETPHAEEAVPCWEMLECTRLECPAYGSDDLRCWLRCGTPGPDGKPASYLTKRERCLACEVYAASSPLLGELGISGAQEVELSEPEHRILAVRTNAVTDRCGRYLGCVSTLHDVTAEREIAVMKNEFVSMVSHELRTPLTSIKGYVDLVVDGEAGEINEIQREFLQIVQENSDRLVSLVNDLLDISRMESGRVHLRIEPLEMDEIVQGVMETFRTMADSSDVELSWDVQEDLPRAAGDRDRVGQVLMNFVSNAIKYSPGGGKAHVAVTHDDGRVLVEVSDTGIGISEEDQEKLFSKFYRVDSTLTREIGGTGLGLSICKSVVELLGGEVGARSVEGEGSTFWFTLPVAHDLVRTPALEGPAVAGGKVLVVDRDPEIADLIETFLVKRGYEVHKCHTASEAYERAVELEPSLITLDVMLDDMDGFDLLQWLKDNEKTSGIPVLVLSIVCDEGKSLRLGAADYLEKPIDQKRLSRIVDSLVGQVASPVALVVDDDRAIVGALSEMLKRRGFAVVGAYDGAEAMAAVAKRHPDLVLLDLRMPVMDGYQVIRELKGVEATSHIPIVVMTAHRIDRDKVDILEMASEHLTKPFSPEKLAERVEELISRGVG